MGAGRVVLLLLLLAGDGGAAVRPDRHAGLRSVPVLLGGGGGDEAGAGAGLAGDVALTGLVALVTDLTAGVTERPAQLGRDVAALQAVAGGGQQVPGLEAAGGLAPGRQQQLLLRHLKCEVIRTSWQPVRLLHYRVQSEILIKTLKYYDGRERINYGLENGLVDFSSLMP